MTTTDFIVQLYCDIDDFMKTSFPERCLRHRGPLPQLSDSEVLTMEIAGEYLGYDQDKKMVAFFRQYYRNWFPHLHCRETFLRQAANLWSIKESLFHALADRYRDTIIVLDSLPIAVCRFARARRCRLFKGLAAYGKELGQQTFYGFRFHLKINSIGMIQDCALTAANISDIHLVRQLTAQDCGLMLADRGYESRPLRMELMQTQGLEISIPTKYGQPTDLPPKVLKARKHTRRLIETVGSQLVDGLHLKKVRARDLWHLTNRIWRKVLTHTFMVIYCLKHDLKPLQFSRLIAA